MEIYRVTVKISAETGNKAKRDVELRVPNGQICSVRKDNGASGGRLDRISKRGN